MSFQLRLQGYKIRSICTRWQVQLEKIDSTNIFSLALALLILYYILLY